ncbi:MAG TPA: hypothetical protein VGT61_11905 [Thermomicrobiales bacterium]|jgi:lysylphosphatidylglycerol synthetase-like protein (DUF2156 family)|nr:hypothetical protein [Thermomicrobiales bacterium]
MKLNRVLTIALTLTVLIISMVALSAALLSRPHRWQTYANGGGEGWTEGMRLWAVAVLVSVLLLALLAAVRLIMEQSSLIVSTLLLVPAASFFFSAYQARMKVQVLLDEQARPRAYEITIPAGISVAMWASLIVGTLLVVLSLTGIGRGLRQRREMRDTRAHRDVMHGRDRVGRTIGGHDPHVPLEMVGRS